MRLQLLESPLEGARRPPGNAQDCLERPGFGAKAWRTRNSAPWNGIQEVLRNLSRNELFDLTKDRPPLFEKS